MANNAQIAGPIDFAATSDSATNLSATIAQNWVKGSLTESFQMFFENISAVIVAVWNVIIATLHLPADLVNW